VSGVERMGVVASCPTIAINNCTKEHDAVHQGGNRKQR
jgi:hypothetical protein